MGMSLLGCGIVSQPTPTWSPSPTLNQDAPGKTLPSVKSNRPPKSRFWDDALCLAPFAVPGPPQRAHPYTRVESARCFHLHASHPSSPRTGQSSCGTRHLPSAIADSEFGDPELGPLCMRDMLRNATFFGFFESLGNQLLPSSRL